MNIPDPGSMGTLLASDRGDRVRLLNQAPINSSNSNFVLYWTLAAVRAHENPALDLAVNLANELDKGVFVYHGISESYPYASDRHHFFQLQGARCMAKECEERGLGYGLYLERQGHRQNHLLDLVNRSVGTVVEERPVSPGREWNTNLARRADVPVWAVDCDCVVPMKTISSGHDRAYKYRDATKTSRNNRIDQDWSNPEPKQQGFIPDDLPFEPFDPIENDISSILNQCTIDHAVGPVPDRIGGSEAGYERWNYFLENHLENYHKLRNDPTRPDAVSRLSPYLHHGHVSPFKIAREAKEADLEGTDKFLDELITWREMAHYFCYNNENYNQFDVLPDWARKTLKEHESDPRGTIYSWESLARAKTDDSFWNLCQESLLKHGELHNNLRMTWAKKLLHWTETPERALKMAIDLNDRYALDGSDPNSYLGILWCFGAFDRPYDRDDSITGRLRPRTTDWHSSRTNTEKLESIVHSLPFEREPSIGIVGAGVAGTSCARVLRDHGLNVTVYEKSRGHGGRASSRYHEGDTKITFDHGAQYFTRKDTRLEKYLNSWLKEEVVGQWDVEPSVIESNTITDKESETKRFVPIPKMNQIVIHLSQEIDKNFNTKITNISSVDHRWELTDDDGEIYLHDYLVLTPPPEQTANILRNSQSDRAREIQGIEMKPTWCYMCLLSRPAGIDFEAAFVNNDSPVDWLARDGSKPGRGDSHTWVLHADHEWSREHLETDRETICDELSRQFLKYTDYTNEIISFDCVHRWRYAKPAQDIERGSSELDGVVVAGDWLNGSRIEGAFLSGQHAAGRILRLASRPGN